MSDQNARGKSKYESPILVPLGEMAKGSGVCTTGSSVVAPACSPGASDAAAVDCTAGVTATRDCTAGTSATRNCSQGVSAIPACTAGNAATGACTAGGLVA
jgi:hypothetical protein